MKTKMICCCALLVMILCQFAPNAYANDGDWTETSRAEWWWKYVFPYPPHWSVAVVVDDIVFDADRMIPGSLDVGTGVSYRFRNTGRTAFSGGSTMMLVHTIRGVNGSVLSSETIARAIMPALGSGETFRLTGTARTASSLRGQRHFIEVQIR